MPTRTKSEDKAFSLVMSNFNSSKEDLEQRHVDFNGFEDLYWSHIKNQDNPWKSSVVDPIIFEAVERAVAHLTSSSPRGKFVEDPGNIQGFFGAQIMNEIVRQQWDRPEARMHTKLSKVIRGGSLFGTSFALLTYRYETRKVKDTEVSYWDEPYFRDLYIYDCFPDPSGTDEDSMKWFILRDYVTLGELRAQNNKKSKDKRYKNLGKLEDAIREKQREEATSKVSAESDVKRNRVNDILGVPSTDIKERIMIYTRFTRTRWITVAPDYGVVIEDRPNPYEHADLPIHMYRDTAYMNQLWGIGIAQPIEKLQKGLNNVLNQRLDNVRLMLSPVIKVRANSKYAHLWKFKPGWKWPMDNMNDVEQFSLQDVTGRTFNDTANYFKDSASKASGSFDVLTRRESSVERTAREVQAATGEQSARLRHKEHNMDEFIARLMKQWAQLNQQFITEPKLVRIVGRDALELLEEDQAAREMIDEEYEYNGPEGPFSTVAMDGKEVKKFKRTLDGQSGILAVTPEDIVGFYDYMPETGSTVKVDPALEQQNIMTAMKVLGESRESLNKEGKDVNMEPILLQLLSAMGLKNVEKIIKPYEGPSPEEQQQEQQAAPQQQTPNPLGAAQAFGGAVNIPGAV